MSAFFEWMAYGLIALGGLVLVAMFVGRRLRAAAEVVERARNDLGDDICRHGVCPDECPSCRPMPPPCPAVVAGDDLAWQAALFGFQRDWERYQILDLMPGERAS